MKTTLTKKMITGGVLSLFLFSSLCIAVSWASQEKAKIVKIEPSRFSVVFRDFLKEFQSSFPKKPPSPPEKDEFETSGEYEIRRNVWEKNYEKAVAEYREGFSKTVPVFELYDLEFEFSRYNADKECFGNIKSSRFSVLGLNPLCDGYEIDISCPYGPVERYAHITINNVCINREKARTLKALTSKLRMRVGFQLIAPYPEDKRGNLKFYFHHVSLYDKTAGKTLFTITDQPLIEIKHGE
jgi:hypothetical protein